MAASSQKLSRDLSMAISFRTRLEQLDCPYIEGVEDSWITELIFKPGEPRIRLLQWLFSRFDSQLNELLDSHHASSDTRMDSRIQRLLYVASALGLCRYDDADLIRGVTSVSKQTSFMDMLIDLVCIADTAEDPRTKAMRSPGTISDAAPLEEQFTQDCWFIDTLASEGKTDNVFRGDVKLLPPDLMKQVDRSWQDQGNTTERPPPDLNELARLAEEVIKDLQRQNEILQELQKQFTYHDRNEKTYSKVTRTLKLVLSELSQLVSGFSYCYENEMRSWCNKSPPILTELGPAFKRVHTLMQQFTSLLNSFDVIRSSHNTVCKDTKEKISQLTRKQNTGKLASVSQAAMDSFQECVSVLEESLQFNESSLSRSANKSRR